MSKKVVDLLGSAIVTLKTFMAKHSKKKKRALNWHKIIDIFAYSLITLGLLFIYLTFGPAVKQEVKYEVGKTIPHEFDATPPNTQFSVVIPKIEAKAPVFSNVDPYNKDAYLSVLQKGVAHAAGTALPDRPGNTYLFAHSTDAFYNVGRYNAIFYLLGKLEQGDEVQVYFEDSKYKYEVQEVKVVPADAVEYLQGATDEKVLTLQTCYPPGTTLKRLVVIAKQIE